MKKTNPTDILINNNSLNRKQFLRKTSHSLCAIAMADIGFRCIDAFANQKTPYYIKPARMWKKLNSNIVECGLCPNQCRLDKGERGICRTRENINGKLYTIVYSRIAAAHVDPVEKKPMFHFLPGSTALSIATAGCNLSCKFCQNWELSQANPEDLNATEITPAELTVNAKRYESKVIAYTYNEPTVQFEYILDSSAYAKKQGIKSVIISNGYANPEAGKLLAENLDGIKIDLKAFTEKFYRDICGGSLAAVQKNLETVFKFGKWLEIVVLVIPTLNDSQSEIEKMCKWVKTNLSGDVPMHFTRFHSMYKIQNLPPTPIPTLEQCRKIAIDQGIKYAYIGNVPGHKWENTYCHKCGKLIIQRSGYFSIKNYISKGRCPYCKTKIPGIWM